jgi:pyruvate, orthophosphate dikinase
MNNSQTHSQLVLFGSNAEPTAALHVFGSKAKTLCAIAKLGLPVPPGFAIAPELCRELADKAQQDLPNLIIEALQVLEKTTGKQLCGTTQPLFLTMRTSAAFSVPGTGDAVLNIGLNDETVEALAHESADARFAFDSYCRFIQNFAQVVMGDDPAAFEDILAL